MNDIILDQCPELNAPDFGNVSVAKTSAMFTATYNCDEGYQIQNGFCNQRFCDPKSDRVSETGASLKWLPFEVPVCTGTYCFFSIKQINVTDRFDNVQIIN